MDKYEYKLKIEEINKLIENQEFSEAEDIADTVDWEKVRDIRTLCIVSDLYKICRRYYDAKEVLLLAYAKNPRDKLIVYSLCELSIKLRDILNTIDFYNEYKELAGDDPSSYILLYKVYEIVEATSQEKIDALEAFQKFSRSYKPRWMYELAYLYHKNGRETDCVNQCNLILSFFRSGKYIIKTIELKKLHSELSSEEEMLYKELTTPDEEIIVPEVNVSLDSTIDLQKELAGHLQAILGEETAPVATDIPVSEAETAEPVHEEVTETVPETVTDDTVIFNIEETTVIEPVSDDTQVISPTPIIIEETAADPQEENTTSGSEEEIDLQPTTVIPVVSDEMIKSLEAQTPKEENTKVIPVKEIEEVLNGSKVEETFTDEDGQINLGEMFASDEDRRVELDEMLTLEGDGQISLVVPDDVSVEKQITGQICIDEVLLMYEERRKKQEAEWDNALFSEIDKKHKDIIQKANEASDSQFKETIETAFPPLKGLDEINTENITEQAPVKEETAAGTSSSEFDFSYLDAFAANAERLDEEAAEASGDTAEFMAINDTVDKMLEEEKAKEEKAQTESSESVEPVLENEASGDAASEEETTEEAETEGEPESEKEPDAESEGNAEEVTEAEPEADTKAATESEPEEIEDTSDIDPNLENEQSADEYEEPAEEVSHDGFTEKQWIRYESFVQTEVCREQIKEAIKKISHEAGIGNVVIGSVDEDSAISLGKYFIEEFNDRGEISGKTVSVKAAVMNAKNPEEVFEALDGGALIITNADELRPETLRGIKEALEVEDRKMFVALTASHRLKHKFIMANSEFLESFNVSVDIEALDDEELVKLAKQYAYNREFGIDDMGKLALHRIIAEKQTNSHSVTYKEVKAIVDSAIKHASRHSLSHFFDVIFGKRYDSNDMIVLREKDFKQ